MGSFLVGRECVGPRRPGLCRDDFGRLSARQKELLYQQYTLLMCAHCGLEGCIIPNPPEMRGAFSCDSPSLEEAACSMQHVAPHQRLCITSYAASDVAADWRETFAAATRARA